MIAPETMETHYLHKNNNKEMIIATFLHAFTMF